MSIETDGIKITAHTLKKYHNRNRAHQNQGQKPELKLDDQC